jgi:putative oxidoreductase
MVLLFSFGFLPFGKPVLTGERSASSLPSSSRPPWFSRDPGHPLRPPDNLAKEHAMPFTVIAIVGRTLLALLFILAGAAKIAGPQPFLDHMAAHHIPGVLLPLVILLELGAGVALMIGWKLPYAAGALALFCVATAIVFHLDLADKAERTLFVKDLAIAGALMVIAAGASSPLRLSAL